MKLLFACVLLGIAAATCATPVGVFPLDCDGSDVWGEFRDGGLVVFGGDVITGEGVRP